MLVAVGALPAVLSPAAAQSLNNYSRYSAVVIDHQTGELLYSRQPDTQRHPASITKVMTLYVAFEEMAAGRLREDDMIRVSAHAAGQAPSKLYLRPGMQISVRDAIGTIATKSANDAAAALAEHISGSEAAFAERMTATARRLGMNATRFMNASGLTHPQHLTTARDIATLSRAMLRDFPDHYRLFALNSYRYAGRDHENHNHLLRTMPGVDGIKTGFTNAAGFTLAASAYQNGRRLVAVVLGGPGRAARDHNMGALLQAGFDVLERRYRGEAITVAARLSEPDDLSDFMLERLAGDVPALDGLAQLPAPPVMVASDGRAPVSVAAAMGQAAAGASVSAGTLLPN
mgnify:CR=1 FL=1